MAPVYAMPLNNDTVSPGVLGFVVFLLLAAATFFLIRSMGKQMKKIEAPREEDLRQQEWERAEAEKAARAGTAAKTRSDDEA
ncbi:hypothetical protein [Spirillospora sp. CA-128828]|uniref:hypothetical protein n=1 Tax=Spirillospora sp. CA-128828 TaxID=3240033 RepID=UPI003D9055A2